MTVYLLALLIGVIAGLRAMSAPALVSWAAYLGWLDLSGTWLAFMGNVWARWILTLFALAELVTDQLPSTPSRTVPIQFGTRILTGAFSGAAVGASGGVMIGGLVAGIIGAVIGTLGGRELRAKLASAFSGDRPAAAECISLAQHGKGIAVSVNCVEGEPVSVGSHVLLAVGRRPNTDDLGLEKAGVATDSRGYITVDDSLASSVPGVWALGDCNGRGAFTHTAYNDFEIVAANLLAGERRRLSDRIPAYALYIDPPLGRVGMTEREARASGRPLLIGSRPMSRVGRAVEKGETQGFMKIVVDAETRRILGAAILGVNGDEAIHGILDIMNADVPYDALERAVPIHPTVSELIPTMLNGLRPIEEKEQ